MLHHFGRKSLLIVYTVHYMAVPLFKYVLLTFHGQQTFASLVTVVSLLLVCWVKQTASILTSHPP